MSLLLSVEIAHDEDRTFPKSGTEHPLDTPVQGIYFLGTSSKAVLELSSQHCISCITPRLAAQITLWIIT